MPDSASWYEAMDERIPMKNNNNENRTLDGAMQEIRELISNMENPECTLEQSFDYYKEGIELLKFCNDSIDKVEKELEILETDE